MLRFKLLNIGALAVMAAVIGRIEFSSAARRCIAASAETVEIGSGLFHADLHVDSTDDPALATVHVALAERPETADLVIIDDGPAADDKRCSVTAATQLRTGARGRAEPAPVIYLSADGPADYRLYLRSRRFTPREAAALSTQTADARF